MKLIEGNSENKWWGCLMFLGVIVLCIIIPMRLLWCEMKICELKKERRDYPYIYTENSRLKFEIIRLKSDLKTMNKQLDRVESLKFNK